MQCINKCNDETYVICSKFPAQICTNLIWKYTVNLVLT